MGSARRSPPLPPKRRGPNGERLCRMCGDPVPKGRLEWCSQECVDARLLQHSVGARRVLLKRDAGICTLCGIDTEQTHEAYRRARRLLYRLAHRSEWLRDEKVEATLARWVRRRNGDRDPGSLTRMTWWDADHIVPLVEGGGHDEANLRTLCLWCHRDETAALARRRAIRAVQHA